MNLNDLRDAIYEDAVAHGLWEGKHNLETICTIVGEEAIELVESAIFAIENKDDAGRIEPKNYRHLIDELADCIISSLSVAGKLGIDIDAAVRRKMEINKARPWKHGKGERRKNKMRENERVKVEELARRGYAGMQEDDSEHEICWISGGLESHKFERDGEKVCAIYADRAEVFCDIAEVEEKLVEKAVFGMCRKHSRKRRLNQLEYAEDVADAMCDFALQAFRNAKKHKVVDNALRRRMFDAGLEMMDALLDDNRDEVHVLKFWLAVIEGIAETTMFALEEGKCKEQWCKDEKKFCPYRSCEYIEKRKQSWRAHREDNQVGRSYRMSKALEEARSVLSKSKEGEESADHV